MKKLILGLVLIGLSQAAFAKSPTKKCPWPYDLEGVKVVRSFAITEKSKLTELQKWQVLRTADRVMNIDEHDSYTNIKQAIKDLRENSEGSEVNYSVLRFEGKTYAEIELYPGGNPYGAIFAGDTVVAERQDGDLICE
jgi:hypothetical protein